MRAFTLRFLAPVFLGAAVLTATAPAYAAVAAGPSAVRADVCPPSSHWDNVLNECVPD
jgi:hypothetical protein